MSATDPLARERFRTILTDNLTRANKSVILDGILEDLPEARFEYRTNEAGIRVRRVVVAGEWEADPEILTASRLLT